MNARTLTLQEVMDRLGRSFIGYDNLLANLQEFGPAGNYPPFNVEKFEDDTYRLTVAVAGFKQDELKITIENGILTIEGKKAQEDEKRVFLHRGIAEREFRRQFKLGEYIVVQGADLSDGMLTIDFKRELPETMKPRVIAIGK